MKHQLFSALFVSLSMMAGASWAPLSAAAITSFNISGEMTDYEITGADVFDIYDDGGDENFTQGGYMNIRAPYGYVLQMTGWIRLGDNEFYPDYNVRLLDSEKIRYNSNDNDLHISIVKKTEDACDGFYFYIEAFEFLYVTDTTYTYNSTNNKYTVTFNLSNVQKTYTVTDENGTVVGTVNAGSYQLEIPNQTKGEHTYTFNDGSHKVAFTCHPGNIWMEKNEGFDFGNGSGYYSAPSYYLTEGESVTLHSQFAIYEYGDEDGDYKHVGSQRQNFEVPQGWIVQYSGTTDFNDQGFTLDADSKTFPGNSSNATRYSDLAKSTSTVTFMANTYKDYSESDPGKGFILEAKAISFVTITNCYTEYQPATKTYNVTLSYVKADPLAITMTEQGTTRSYTLPAGDNSEPYELTIEGLSRDIHTFTLSDGVTTIDYDILCGVYFLPRGNDYFTAYLSEGESVLVYDEGGPDGNTMPNHESSISFNIPENCIVHGEGTCDFADNEDSYLQLPDENISESGDFEFNSEYSILNIGFRSDDYGVPGFEMTLTVSKNPLSNINYTKQVESSGTTYRVDFTFDAANDAVAVQMDGTTLPAGIAVGATSYSVTGVAEGVHTFRFSAGAWSTEIQVDCSNNFIMPKTGTNNIYLKNKQSIMIYDDGGATGNYSNSCNSTINISTDNGCKLKVEGTYNTESNYDKLYIASTTYTGSGSINTTDLSSPCAIKFTSDGSVNYSGFALKVTAYGGVEPVITPCAVLSSDSTTLSFYCDASDHSTEGTVYTKFNTAYSNPAWYSNLGTVTKVVFDPSFAIHKPTSFKSWFYKASNLKTIEGIEYLDTSEATTMSDMFYNCSSLEALDLSTFNTAKVTTMSSMFYGCSSLTALDLSNFNTDNVENTYGMFRDCKELSALNISGFTCEKDTTMYNMFSGCKALKTLNLSNLNTRNVKTAQFMFYNCSSLEEIIFGENCAFENTTNMSYMFDGCSCIPLLDLSTFDFRKVADISGIFYYCNKVKEIKFGEKAIFSSLTSLKKMFVDLYALETLDLSTFDTSTITDMANMFSNCTSLTTLNLSGLDFRNATDVSNIFNNCPKLKNLSFGENAKFNSTTSLHGMFYGCKALENLDLSSFGTNKITDMANMFYNCENLTTVNLSSFDTGSLTNMSKMFANCDSLASLDLSSFDFQKVTDITYFLDNCNKLKEIKFGEKAIFSSLTSLNGMFCYCSNLESIDIGHFGTSTITEMSGMFKGCTKLASLDLSSFDTGSLTDMSQMFYGCQSLTSLDLSSFDFQKVTNFSQFVGNCNNLKELKFGEKAIFSSLTSMNGMFDGCSSLETLDVSHFGTSTITDMRNMFLGCSKLTSLDLRSFDFKNVTTLSSIFQGCTMLKEIKFAETVDFSSLTSMYGMFNSCKSLKSIDLSGFKTGNVTEMGELFYDCDSLASVNLSSFNTSKVTDMHGMFENCKSLTTLDISNFNTSNVTSMSEMFASCTSLQALDLSNFDISQTSTYGTMDMFCNCTSLAELDLCHVSGNCGYLMFCNFAIGEGCQPNITLPKEWSTIGTGAFLNNYDANITALTPNMLTLDELAFGEYDFINYEGEPVSKTPACLYVADPTLYTDASVWGTNVKQIPAKEVTIPEMGYATFYLHNNVVIPTGVQAFVPTFQLNKKGNSTLLMGEALKAGDILPAHTAVVIKGAPGKYSFAFTAEDTPAHPVSGLSGCCQTTSATCNRLKGQTTYVLGLKDNTLGFYPNTGTTLAANEAYIAIDEDVALENPRIEIVFSALPVTSIEIPSNINCYFNSKEKAILDVKITPADAEFELSQINLSTDDDNASYTYLNKEEVTNAGTASYAIYHYEINPKKLGSYTLWWGFVGREALGELSISGEANLNIGYAHQLNQGWNWISTFCNTLSSPEDIDNLLDIRSQEQSACLMGDFGIVGDLETMSNAAYKLKVSEATELLSMNGTRSFSDQALLKGYTWVYNPYQFSYSISDLGMSSIFQNNDKLITRTELSTYYSGMWLPEINIQGGEFFMIKRNESGNISWETDDNLEKAIELNTGSSSPVAPRPSSVWEYDPTAYSENMALIAIVDSEGPVEIGAFVGEECRGESRMVEFNGQRYYFLNIHGQGGETVSFQAYDGTYFLPLETQLTFCTDMGTIDDPVFLGSIHDEGIRLIHTDRDYDGLYDVLGRHCSKAERGGIYLKVGKKEIVTKE